MLLVIFISILQSTVSHYPGFNDAAIFRNSSVNFVGNEPDGTNGGRIVPVAPPRIPAIDRLSFGYRPAPPPLRRNAKSAGQCSFDQSSWRLEPQTAIANAIMFDRATGLTCEECIEKCQHFQDSNSEWICRSLTFDHHWKICDLFAVNGTSPPHFLTEYLNRDYLEYLKTRPDARLAHFSGTTYQTGNNGQIELVPSKSEQTAETEFASYPTSDYQAVRRKSIGKSGEKSCKKDDVTRYMMILNYGRRNLETDAQLVETGSPRECAAACDRGEKSTCSSAVYTGKECKLSASRVSYKSREDFTSSANSTYLEKVCLPAYLAGDTRKLWPTVLDHILVGHVMEVVDAPSLAKCQIACLRAEREFAFTCRSAMWYPNDEEQNCLLNSESRATKENVFVAEDQGERMLYFDVPRTQSKRWKSDSSVLRDEPVKDEYTRWSLCNSAGLQHRYKKCNEKADVRKCPKQTKSCKQVVKNMEKSKCVAVRDSQGRKKCPYGIRKLPDGRNEYCRDPIDCDL